MLRTRRGGRRVLLAIALRCLEHTRLRMLQPMMRIIVARTKTTRRTAVAMMVMTAMASEDDDPFFFCQPFKGRVGDASPQETVYAGP